MNMSSLRLRRSVTFLLAVIAIVATVYANSEFWQPAEAPPQQQVVSGSALQALASIPIKGRAPKTGYERTEFGNGWTLVGGCDTRNIILHRDLTQPVVGANCKILSGVLADPYTGSTITFKKGEDTSADIQIDHVVALSDAWQKGAQQLDKETRVKLANDPLELLAVDGPTNQAKGDGDAATWLPPNKAFRCQYIARQISVKQKYELWMTEAEHDAIQALLVRCPNQLLPVA